MPSSIEVVVGGLEGGVGGLGAVLVAEQRAEDGDLGLTHGVEHVLAGCVGFGAGSGSPTAVAAASKALQDQAVVGDGGAGHVEDGELESGGRGGIPVRSRGSEAELVGGLFGEGGPEGHAAAAGAGDHPDAVGRRCVRRTSCCGIEALAVDARPSA